VSYDWTGWKANDSKTYKSPYADWDEVIGGLHPLIRKQNQFLKRGILPNWSKQESKKDPSSKKRERMGDVEFWNALQEELNSWIYGDGKLRPPLPTNVLTGKLKVNNDTTHEDYVDCHGVLPDVLERKPDADDDLSIDQDSVIVGMIDVGVPLGHRRTRLADGRTRILAAWQQAAERTDLNIPDDGDLEDGQQMYIPFGREILASELNELLKSHSDHGLGRRLDEEAFNRATFTEDYRNVHGHRELGLKAAHGAHTLDSAAGLDPKTAKDATERMRIMVVNLPERSLVGHSARFLEYFAVHAIMRIVRLSDALWVRDFGDQEGIDNKGFHIVINLSFGMQAGPRDGSDLIARALELINNHRKGKYRPVHLCIPAGNDNLERNNANFVLKNGAKAGLEWHLSPEDQSANFVEVWSPMFKLEKGVKAPLYIQVEASDGTTSGFRGAKDGEINTLMAGAEPIARIYCQHIFTPLEGVGDISDTYGRIRYVIATKQTALFEDTALAPAGNWQIRVKNKSGEVMDVDLSVQIDQSIHPMATANQSSYFEEADYREYDETGRVIDSYTYSLDQTKTPEMTDESNVLRRHGTLNAIGISKFTATVAGHRDTDGRPEPTSGTGLENTTHRPIGGGARNVNAPLPNFRVVHNVPTLSMPTRRGAAHFGILSSGSRDGSVAALQGTSFAASQLTKKIANYLLMKHVVEPSALVQKFQGDAVTTEMLDQKWGMIAYFKAGKGRLEPDLDSQQLGRFQRISRRELVEE